MAKLESAERMQLAHFDDGLLEAVEQVVARGLVAIALKIVEQREAEIGLIGVLDDAQDGTEDVLLIRLEIGKQLALNGWRIDEARRVVLRFADADTVVVNSPYVCTVA